MDKQKYIKAEIKKLKSLFKEMDADTKKATSSLINEAAFMSASLVELREDIDQNGYTERYQNGANEFGIKQRPEVDIYNKLISNYLKTMKQLSQMLPKASYVDNDNFEDFINSRNEV